MDVVPCPSSPLLASRIARELGLKIANVTFRKFPDGELYVRVESKDDEHVVVGSLNSNDDLVALMLTLDALRGSTKLVVPYMGYARQDKVFIEGEAVSIRVVARTLESYADQIYTVNIHSPDAASHFRKLVNLDAMGILGKLYAGRDVVMVSPDRGSLERVKVAAKSAGCEWDYMEKIRIDANTVEISPKEIDVEGREVVIVDDIISTGGTVVEAAKRLWGLGAKNVEAACVHAVLAAYAAVRLISSGISDIVATDTVECAFSRVSVASVIANALR